MKPTQEQIIAWAREAGFEVYDEDKFMNTHISDTLLHIHTAAENLAALAYEAGRKDENEACAKVCEELGYYVKHGGWTCADEIRERGALALERMNKAAEDNGEPL